MFIVYKYMCCLINHVYMHSFRSIIEATEKLKSNLIIFAGVGAFEQLFGPVRGEFEQRFSKKLNARGVARGGCCSFDLTGTLRSAIHTNVLP